MFYVYVLKSESSGQFYTGHCASLEQRLGQHNHGITKFTRNRGPWRLVYQEPFASRAEAMRREKYLKTGKGREEVRAIVARNSVG